MGQPKPTRSATLAHSMLTARDPTAARRLPSWQIGPWRSLSAPPPRPYRCCRVRAPIPLIRDKVSIWCRWRRCCSVYRQPWVKRESSSPRSRISCTPFMGPSKPSSQPARPTPRLRALTTRGGSHTKRRDLDWRDPAIEFLAGFGRVDFEPPDDFLRDPRHGGGVIGVFAASLAEQGSAAGSTSITTLRSPSAFSEPCGL
jgi:hypothetical protein